MWRLVLLGCCFVSLAPPQVIPSTRGQSLPEQLKVYLGLTPAQVTQWELNLNDFQKLLNDRERTISQLQSSINVERNRPQLDSATIGIEYAQIELTCRNLRDESLALQDRTMALLDASQKAKLKALDDAAKLMPLFSQAQDAGVLLPTGSIAFQSNQTGFAYTGFYLNSTSVISTTGALLFTSSASSCQRTTSTPWLDASDFRRAPVIPAPR